METGGGLLEQLGIDWKLFLSQAFNFLILLVVLRTFVYKPLMTVVKERNNRIQEGLDKAAEADKRLEEVDNISKEKIKEAEQSSIKIIKDTEDRAKLLDQSLQKKAEQKQAELLHQIEVSHKKQQEESRDQVAKQAAELVKRFIVKTVELKPEAIDEALIKKAVLETKHEI